MVKLGSAHSDEQAVKKYFQNYSIGDFENAVLVNKLGITDRIRLEKAEALFVERALKKGLSAKALEMSQAGLKTMHFEMFGEIYHWAGEYRDYTTGRGLPFCRPEFIESSLDKIYQTIHLEISANMSHVEFAKVAGHFIGELNVIHPFVDGNGRTQRQSLQNLATLAHKKLDLSKLNKADWYYSAEVSHMMADNSEFARIIEAMLI